jgi:hypothetical protein
LSIFLRLVSCNRHRVLGLVLDSEEHLCLRPPANTARSCVAVWSHVVRHTLEFETLSGNWKNINAVPRRCAYQSRPRTKPGSFKPFDPQNVGADHGMGEWATSWSVS